MKNYGKIFKALQWVLVIVSVVLLVWGFAAGFESNSGNPVDVLLYWAYAMVALALLAIVCVDFAIGAKNDAKFLVKIICTVLGTAAVCAIVYFIAPGDPALGLLEQPSAGTLKITDTILDLTYLLAAAAILSIVVGEIVMAIRNRK